VPPEGDEAGGVRHYDDWRQHEPITVGSPAAGAGFSHAVPSAVVQRVVSVSFTLVNAVAAANRLPRVEYLNAAGAVFFAVAAPFVTTSGVTSRFNFAIGQPQYGANDAAQIGGPLPDFMLIGGLAVRVVVGAIDAGDQISGASLFVDQYPIRD
jgi:hypothetical protein